MGNSRLRLLAMAVAGAIACMCFAPAFAVQNAESFVDGTSQLTQADVDLARGGEANWMNVTVDVRAGQVCVIGTDVSLHEPNPMTPLILSHRGQAVTYALWLSPPAVPS